MTEAASSVHEGHISPEKIMEFKSRFVVRRGGELINAVAVRASLNLVKSVILTLYEPAELEEATAKVAAEKEVSPLEFFAAAVAKAALREAEALRENIISPGGKWPAGGLQSFIEAYDQLEEEGEIPKGAR